MRKFLRQYAVTALFLLVVGLSVVSGFFSYDDLSKVVSDNSLRSAVIFSLLMCGATIIAPVTLLPVVPMIAPILGPFVTGISCWIGWTLGSIIAFCIARYGGRPLLVRVIDPQTLKRFESKLPKETHFAVIVALRLVIPVDVLSYVLGLVSSVSLITYTLASALGIFWFSFAFAYMGDALFASNAVLFVTYSVVSAIIFVGALWYVRSVTRAEKGESVQD